MKSEILSDLSGQGKRRPWKERKIESTKLAQSFVRLGNGKKAERINNCGTFLTFNECPQNHMKQLIHAHFCKVRLCALCNWRRSIKLVYQLKSVTHMANTREQLGWLFLTLTVKNVPGDQLSEEITKIFQSWQRLSQRKVFKKSVVGWFRALEVTRNDKNWTFHPHLHVLLAVKPSYFSGANYINQKQWSNLWKESLRVDYIPIVDIRRIKPRKSSDQGIQNLQELEKQRAIEAAVVETAKYPIKPGSYLVNGNEQATDHAVSISDQALLNRRLIAYGGILKELWNELDSQKKDIEGSTADLVEGDENRNCTCSTCGSDMLEYMYRWNIGISNYKKV